MKPFLVASLILLIAVNARAQTPPNAAKPLRSRLGHDVIKEAVQQTLAEEKKDPQPDEPAKLGAQRYEEFARTFANARVPDCLHSQALKFQPTFFSGLLATPFVALAALRGKCR